MGMETAMRMAGLALQGPRERERAVRKTGKWDLPNIDVTAVTLPPLRGHLALFFPFLGRGKLSWLGGGRLQGIMSYADGLAA